MAKGLVDQGFKDFAGDWEKADWTIATWLSRVTSCFWNRNNRCYFPARRKLANGYTFEEELGQDRRKLRRQLLENNHWNTIGTAGFGAVKA